MLGFSHAGCLAGYARRIMRSRSLRHNLFERQRVAAALRKEERRRFASVDQRLPRMLSRALREAGHPVSIVLHLYRQMIVLGDGNHPGQIVARGWDVDDVR